MQKGRFVRAVKPYTSSEENWPGAFRPYLANQYVLNGQFSYGIGLQTFAAAHTHSCVHPFGALSFEWDFTFKVGIFQFNGVLLIEPTTGAPTWDVGFRLRDIFGGQMIATYRGPIVVVLPQDFFNQTMFTLLTFSATGSFHPVIPTWQAVGVNYPDEL